MGERNFTVANEQMYFLFAAIDSRQLTAALRAIFSEFAPQQSKHPHLPGYRPAGSPCLKYILRTSCQYNQKYTEIAGPAGFPSDGAHRRRCRSPMPISP
ncbi:hypothetical protein D3C81_1768150 [compost metagenome]